MGIALTTSGEEVAVAIARRSGRKRPHFPDGHFKGEDGEHVSNEARELGEAVQFYKRYHQRPFPAWSEIVEILGALGYERDRNKVTLGEALKAIRAMG